VALAILRRAVAGVPADLLWRRHQLAVATAAAATVAGLGMVRADAAPVVVLSAMGGAGLLAVLAAAGRRHRRRAA
jgi:hypothetical protein